MKHKIQFFLVLALTLLVSWVTSTSPQVRNPPQLAQPSMTSDIQVKATSSATPFPPEHSISPTRVTSTPVSKPVKVAATESSELASLSAALLPAYHADIQEMAKATRYTLNVTIANDLQHVRGNELVTYFNRTGYIIRDLMLRLYPNTEYLGGEMHIYNVQVGGLPASIQPLMRPVTVANNSVNLGVADLSVVSITLALPVLPGQSISLSMDYVITIPMQATSGYRTFGWADQVLALPQSYAMLPLRVKGNWLVDAAPTYGDIVAAETSLYKVHIEAPSDVQVVSSGVCSDVSFTQREGARATPDPPLTEMDCVAGPVRDFAIHASRLYEVVTSTVTAAGGKITVSSYYLPGHRQAAEQVLGYASSSLLFYEHEFGVYPYREFKVFPSATIAGGIEYPMVAGVLDTLYGADPVYLEWIVAHETAHQWWYGMIGSDQINQPWLDESLAQYSTLMYMEHRYGDAFASELREKRLVERYKAELVAGNDTIVDQPTSSFERGAYFPIVYGKGPLFYDEVRRLVGSARFTEWLHSYFEKNRYGFVERDDLLTAADETGIGVIVRQSFDKWMHGINVQ